MTDNHYSPERDSRVKQTAEVFTPLPRVQSMLDSLGIDWANPPQDKKFLDPTCGSGNFLVELAKRGIPVHMLFGVDLMQDNIDTCKSRLREVYGDTEEVNYHLDRNIICENALTYHYDFYDHYEGIDPSFFS